MRADEVKKRLNEIKASGQKEDRKFTVAVCGVFSSGKSSILNYFLDVPEFKLPSGIFPVTKLVTRIEYGDTLAIYLKENGKEERRPVSREEFERLVTGETALPFPQGEICIEIPALILKQGITFIDTPGFLDEMGGELEKNSREAVRGCDLALFCASAVMFGNQFEKEYIEELERETGNFCMVVNHMDACNTEQDAEDIRAQARRMMRGKGGSLLEGLGKEKCFFTVAVGPRQAMNGFDSFIWDILENDRLKREIKRSTAENRKRFLLERLREESMEAVDEKKRIFQEVQEKHRHILEALKREEELKRFEREQDKQKRFSVYEGWVDNGIDMVEKQIWGFTHVDFIHKVREASRNTFLPLGRLIDAEMGFEEEKGEAYLGFKTAISHLNIPRPQAERIKKRGFWGRMATDACNLLFFHAGPAFVLDDGYDTVYRNYEQPAIQAVRQKLRPRLIEAVQKSVEGRREGIPVLKSGLEEELSRRKKSLEEWETFWNEYEELFAAGF